MFRKIYAIATLPFCIAVLTAAVVNDDWLTILLTRLDNASAKYPQENVHLHTDKPYYNIGEDIWMKAYVVNAENNELSALGNVLYIAIVDAITQFINLLLYS